MGVCLPQVEKTKANQLSIRLIAVELFVKSKQIQVLYFPKNFRFLVYCICKTYVFYVCTIALHSAYCKIT
jgi:hypothetical protein